MTDEYEYIAGRILNEDNSDAIEYIVNLLFLAYPYKEELFEEFDAYAEAYKENE